MGECINCGLTSQVDNLEDQIDQLKSECDRHKERIQVLEFWLNEISESDLVISNLKSIAKNALKSAR